jgi:sarcosine oxidase
MRREVDAADEALLRNFAEKYFPQGTGPTMALRACLFTNTPDEHFILDHHPAHPQVVIASPCSGHGYKFCSVVGEILADLASGDGTTPHEIGFLRLGRYTR